VGKNPVFPLTLLEIITTKCNAYDPLHWLYIILHTSLSE